MNTRIFAGSSLAIMAAFFWSTYYIFLHMIGRADAFTVFIYPSLVGGFLFALYGFVSEGNIRLPERKADLLIPAFGYLSSQIVIIFSARINGGVLTSTFVLVGDAILSPFIIFALGRNRFIPRFSLFIPGLLVLVVSAFVLSAFGGKFAVHSLAGLVLIVADPILISLFYVYLNGRIMIDGMARILAPTFLVASLISLPVFLFLYPVFYIGVPDPYELLVLIVIGVTSMFGGYFLFFAASKISGFTLSSILMSMIPVFTLLLSAAFISIPLTFSSVVLVFLAVFGASLCTLSFGEGRSSETADSGS